VELAAAARGKVLTVPVSAVIDSGTRQIVLVQVSEGRFEPREVKLGARSDDQVEVRDGVREGEQGGGRRQLPDRRRKQPQGGGRRLRSGGATIRQDDAATKAGPASTVHQAEGKVETIDAGSGVASISHGPVASLKWPPMTMAFKVANESLRKDLKPGAAISFEFVERGPGEWVITSVKPAPRPADKGAGAAPANPHAGH
jgi:Cu(I)/Ag(I) efflux system membrane fusion protein